MVINHMIDPIKQKKVLLIYKLVYQWKLSGSSSI